MQILPPIARQRASLAQRVLAPKSAQPAEQDMLVESMSKMDTGVLDFLVQEGVSLQVARVGQDLLKTGVLRDQPLENYRAQLPELKKTAAAYHQHYATRRQKIEQAETAEQAKELRRSLRINFHNRAVESELPLTLYSPDPARVLYPNQSLDSLLTKEAVALEGMAVAHGAQSTAEKETFYQLVEAINGERLQQARAETLSQLRGRMSPDSSMLAEVEKHPERIPIDSIKHGIYLPSLFFAGPPEQRQLLDRYDFDAVNLWHGREGKIVDKHVNPQADADTELNGEYFPSRKVLVRPRALPPEDRTTVHELAHAVDWILEEKAPQWYSGWKVRVERSYHKAKSQRSAITPYSMANLREYVAEGIAHYYYEPERLRATDPSCYDLMKEMLTVASTMAGHDPELEQGEYQVLADTQKVIQGVVDSLQKDREATVARLKEAQQSLQAQKQENLKKAGTQATLAAMRSGLMAGAVQALLGWAAGEQLSKDSEPVELAFEARTSLQNGQGEQGYQKAFIAGESLASHLLPE